MTLTRCDHRATATSNQITSAAYRELDRHLFGPRVRSARFLSEIMNIYDKHLAELSPGFDNERW
jgi:hypothetical protein